MAVCFISKMPNPEIFQFYFNLGYKVIPLYKNTKVPVFPNWYKNYSFNSINNFVKTSDETYNIGILLGDVIDIEGDCDKSNKLIDDMLSGIKHPIFSSNKSKHHLFKSKIKKLTRITNNGIEYRGFRHQSVIPPSCHESGIIYEWIEPLVPFIELPILPDFISNIIYELTLSKKNKKANKNALKPGHTEIICKICNRKIKINKKRLSKEISIFKSISKFWECQKCRKIDLRPFIRNSNNIRDLRL